MAKNTNKETFNYGDFRYEMSKEYLNLLKKGPERHKDRQEILCKWVNDCFGIKGNCTSVTLI